MFAKENTVNSVQKHDHNNDVKIRQEKLFYCKNI